VTSSYKYYYPHARGRVAFIICLAHTMNEKHDNTYETTTTTTKRALHTVCEYVTVSRWNRDRFRRLTPRRHDWNCYYNIVITRPLCQRPTPFFFLFFSFPFFPNGSSNRRRKSRTRPALQTAPVYRVYWVVPRANFFFFVPRRNSIFFLVFWSGCVYPA